ncbi:MAG: TIGR03089 family protein [Sporichthyaceae bacterium]
MRTVAELLTTAGGRDPGRPFVTFYDDASGERVELSFTTTENWVAKTANFLTEELAAEPGEHIALLLTTHWQSVIWYLACWRTGVAAAPEADPADCAHVVTDPGGVERAGTCPGTRVLVPMLPFGRPAVDPPAGFLDYAAEVPACPDQFAPPVPLTGEEAALLRGGRRATWAELIAAADAAAARWDVGREDRVLVTTPLSTEDGLLAAVLVPLVTGASVVLCVNADPAALPRRVEAEKVTRRLGVVPA